jgi:hypothetical protein
LLTACHNIESGDAFGTKSAAGAGGVDVSAGTVSVVGGVDVSVDEEAV